MNNQQAPTTTGWVLTSSECFQELSDAESMGIVGAYNRLQSLGNAAYAGPYGASAAGRFGAVYAGPYGASAAGRFGAVYAGPYGASAAGQFGAAYAGPYGASAAG
ncbi:MAG: hypothetical protein V7L04_16760 [Nostoc sp.]|uniref:hypothetical protein n=1 Tax=Nostoc sp. TaxID=1180 RepID=UPI002FF8B3CE